jgi:hypothetical protein
MIVRSLKHYDERFAEEFLEAFNHFYQINDKNKVVALVEKVLETHGGRLFAGFSLGKQ